MRFQDIFEKYSTKYSSTLSTTHFVNRSHNFLKENFKLDKVRLDLRDRVYNNIEIH